MKWAWLTEMVILAVMGAAVWAAEQPTTSAAANDQATATNFQPVTANDPVTMWADPTLFRPQQPPTATEKLVGCINDMRNATAPGEIVAAHKRCELLTPVSLRLDTTFVERMAARGEPELAYEAAKRVLEQNPNNGLARGVVAYNEARAGEWGLALRDVIQANADRPHDPLIEVTAGWVLAWADNAAEASTMPAELRPKIDFLRQTAGESAAFQGVYRSAALDYRREAAAIYALTYGGTFADDPRPSLVQLPLRIPVGPVINNGGRWFTFPNGLDMRQARSLWWFPGEAVVNGHGVVRSAPDFAYQWPSTSGYKPAPLPAMPIGP